MLLRFATFCYVLLRFCYVLLRFATFCYGLLRFATFLLRFSRYFFNAFPWCWGQCTFWEFFVTLPFSNENFGVRESIHKTDSQNQFRKPVRRRGRRWALKGCAAELFGEHGGGTEVTAITRKIDQVGRRWTAGPGEGGRPATLGRKKFEKN